MRITTHGVSEVSTTRRSASRPLATRQLREEGPWPHSVSPWADKGRKKRSVARAIEYVLYDQGDDLPGIHYPVVPPAISFERSAGNSLPSQQPPLLALVQYVRAA